MEELKTSSRQYLEGTAIENKVFVHPLCFNVLPHIDIFQDNLYTREEMKVTWETQKIFNEPSMRISCTAVRTPTLRAHAEAITIETVDAVDIQDAR